MIRTTLIGASAIALMATGAYAQVELPKQTKSEMEVPEAAPQEPAPQTAANVSKTKEILDAAQVMTRDEAKLFAESEFKRADLDRDGTVDKDEFIAYATIRAPLKTTEPSAAAESTAEAAAPAGDDAQAVAEAPATAEEEFAQISKDDEKISQNELAEVRVAQFDAADVNADEALDTEERMQFAALTAPKAPQNAF